MAKTMTITLEVADHVTAEDLNEGLEAILINGWSINDGVDGEHPLEADDISAVLSVEED